MDLMQQYLHMGKLVLERYALLDIVFPPSFKVLAQALTIRWRLTFSPDSLLRLGVILTAVGVPLLRVILPPLRVIFFGLDAHAEHRLRNL